MKCFISIIFIFTLIRSGVSDLPSLVNGIVETVPGAVGDVLGGIGTLLNYGPTTEADINEDATLTAPQLITKYGFVSEIHHVTTNDGYILEMHRIPGSTERPPAENKPVVFLMHGLLGTSGNWVVMGPRIGLAYLLVQLGYDVWMGNARGNRYSRNHITLNPDGLLTRAAYWDFSWHEIGIYDLPAMIDYALQETGQQKLHYIGHSQGTTAYFVMASMKPEYNDKVHIMQALAPVAYMSHVKSPLLQAGALATIVTGIPTSLLGNGEFAPHNEFMVLAGTLLCQQNAVAQAVCTQPIFLMGGYDSEQFNYTMLPVILGDLPGGASTKQILHYGQEVVSAKFRQYDKGLLPNLSKYGQNQPPNYNLTNIRSSVALHYALNDWCSDPVDVSQLAAGLPNLLGKYEVPLAKFNHFDFIWANDVRELLYRKVVQIIKSVV